MLRCNVTTIDVTIDIVCLSYWMFNTLAYVVQSLRYLRMRYNPSLRVWHIDVVEAAMFTRPNLLNCHTTYVTKLMTSLTLWKSKKQGSPGFSIVKSKMKRHFHILHKCVPNFHIWKQPGPGHLASPRLSLEGVTLTLKGSSRSWRFEQVTWYITR